MKSNKSAIELPVYNSVKFDYERNSKDSTKKEIINRINELNEKLSPKRSYNTGSFQTKSYGSELVTRSLAISQTHCPLKSRVLAENFSTRRESDPCKELEKTVENDNKLEKKKKINQEKV